jgi:hypothetical protein
VADVVSIATKSVEETRTSRLRVRPWPLLVALSLVLLVGGTAVCAALWLLSGGTTSASYTVRGSPVGVQIRVVSGDVAILGGAEGGVSVNRTDRSTFGRGPIEWRRWVGRRLEIASTCPTIVFGTCAASYRVVIPDNVPVSVRADHGTIRLEGYRGSALLTTGAGAIIVDAFCGYTLRATTVRGDVSVVASCSPELLEVRSRSGDISATVPADHYRIDASAGGGPGIVRGLTSDPNAPWQIQALSANGHVTVEAGS